MNDLENRIFDFLIKQKEAKCIREMYEDPCFCSLNEKNISKKLLELFLSKAIERNVIGGIAYYYLDKNESANPDAESRIEFNTIEIEKSQIENIDSETQEIENKEDESNISIKDDVETEVRKLNVSEVENSEQENIENEKETENIIKEESKEDIQQENIEEKLDIQFDNGKILVLNDYRVNIPVSFNIQNENKENWIAWMPQENSNNFDNALIKICSGENCNDNINFEIYNQNIWKCAVEFEYWNSKIDYSDKYKETEYTSILARYVIGGCVYFKNENKYILKIHLNNSFKSFEITVNEKIKDYKEKIQKIIFDFANSIIPREMNLKLPEIDSTYYIEKEFSSELLNEWKNTLEITLKETKTEINQLIEIELMKIKYEESIGFLNMDGKKYKVMQIINENIHCIEECFYKSANFIEKIGEKSKNDDLLIELYDFVNSVLLENKSIVFKNDKINVSKELTNFRDLNEKILTDEVKEKIENKNKFLQLKNENKMKKEKIENEIVEIEKENAELIQQIKKLNNEVEKIKSVIQGKNEDILKQQKILNKKNAEAEKEFELQKNAIIEQITFKKGSLETYRKEVDIIKEEQKHLSILAFMKKNNLNKQLEVYNNNIKTILEELRALETKKSEIYIPTNSIITECKEKIENNNKEIQINQKEKKEKNRHMEEIKIKLEANNNRLEYLNKEKNNLIV